MLVAIGDNCIDRYLPPLASERIGGNAVNVAANSATHGYPAGYAGVVGDDAQGTRILTGLRSIGVDVDCVVRVPGPTGLTEIRHEGGDYTVVLERYGVSDQVRITGDLTRHLRAHATRIHLTVTGQATLLIEALRSLPMPISVDLGSVRREQDLERFAGLLPDVSEAFFSAGGSLDDPTIEAILDQAVRLGARTAIATRGERGCMALHDGRKSALTSCIAAHEIVDPLGAGDAFIAGYLSTLRGNLNHEATAIEDGLITASTWAAQACRQLGGWPGAER